MFKKFVYFLLFPSFVFSLNKYNMDIAIDLSKKILSGKETINFTNTFNFPINSLYFNLYQNGFQEDSTLWKESDFLDGYKEKFGEEAFSYTEILNILFEKNIVEYRFVSPEDGNLKDKTLIEVILPRTIFPEETIELEIYFKTKLHRFYLRSGYSKESIFLMQWYPKMAVFESGKWIAHQFHLFTEFYGEFSDFEINFKIPFEWEVVSTGKIFEEKGREGKNIKIIAENVHDVAIALSRELKKIKRNISITEDNPIEINIFVPSEYVYKIPKVMDILAKAFNFYNEWIGPYLYNNFSCLFPPWHTSQGQIGMEYPQLIMCGIKHFEDKRSLSLEYVIAHEFAHQYFYGLIASDEVEDPWLDEGFTTYVSSKFLEKNFGDIKINMPLLLKFNSLKNFYINPFLYINLNYYNDEGIGKFALAGYQYPNYLNYRIYAYNKPAMALKTLENYAGEEKMKIFLQDYFSNYSFLHPHTENLLKLIEKNFGIGWAQNFYNLANKPQLIDYSVEIISENKFFVKRKGEFFVPLQILVIFSDKTKETINWDGYKNFQIFTFQNKKINKVIIDPENKVLLDVNPSNNIANFKKEKNDLFFFIFSKIILLLEGMLCWF